MRTAVLRVNVDPTKDLDDARLAAGLARLREQAGERSVVIEDAAGAVDSREIQILVDTTDAGMARREVVRWCAGVFGTVPTVGPVTFLSRGTDADAHGVLAGFGLTGDVERAPDASGFDVVSVTLRASDLDRVPESRVQTALEAALNCEVRILLG
ncbi:hypothetical protein [Nocardia sp. NPDC057668]|uniref:hypothetical protein n=1 Tax=Nocardia sp. NPDC057668 TaxID=3346202 RepID=UPI00366F5C93